MLIRDCIPISVRWNLKWMQKCSNPAYIFWMLEYLYGSVYSSCGYHENRMSHHASKCPWSLAHTWDKLSECWHTVMLTLLLLHVRLIDFQYSLEYIIKRVAAGTGPTAAGFIRHSKGILNTCIGIILHTNTENVQHCMGMVAPLHEMYVNAVPDEKLDNGKKTSPA